MDRWFTHNTCPFIDTVFFDIVSTCGLAILQRKESESVLVAWTQLTASIEIGPEYELGTSSRSDSPLRAEALTRLFVIDRVIVRPESLGTIVSEDYQSIGDALMLLATEDPDTCCAALDTLETIIEKVSPDAPKKPISLIMAHIHRVTLHASDAEVLSKAQGVLATALTTSPSRRDEFFSLLPSTQLLTSLTRLESQALSTAPSNAQSALHLLAFFLEHAFHSLPSARDEVLEATARYIRLLRCTIIDTNPFDTRFAAVQSIRALDRLWGAQTGERPAPHVLGLGLVLYDMLCDDDDEIRDLAAVAVSVFISTTATPSPSAEENDTKPTVPLLSTSLLLTHLLTLFPSSPHLGTHALRRLLPTPTPLLSTPFATILHDATQPQTALFAQERQNLFHDPATDALAWHRTLCATTSLAPDTQRRAALWTADALTRLTARYDADADGALGWASPPDVFAWVLRILCLADVVLRVFPPAALAPQAKTSVKLGLARVVAAMQRGGAHGVLVERAEAVLEADVLRGLGGVRGVAGVAPGYAGVGGWL